MTIPWSDPGRGAWTTIGKGNGSRLYEFKTLLPLDGEEPTRDINYQAVHLGVRGIQARLNDFRIGTALPLTGVYDVATANRVKAVQARLNEVPPYDLTNVPHSPLTIDGRVGAITARMLFRGVVWARAKANYIPFKYLWGLMLLESAADPGAVGYYSPADRGLVQINLPSHPEITVFQAFEPNFAINYGATRFAASWKKYSGKTPELQVSCAIADHNSPVKASQWYSTGVPPTTTIARYVELVLQYSTMI